MKLELLSVVLCASIRNADTLCTLRPAEEVGLIADVARIARDEAGKLIGYQRPERRNHVKQILITSIPGDAVFPNGLILALPDTVHFCRSSRGPLTSDGRSQCRDL